MTTDRWLIEMLLPSGTIEARSVTADRTAEQLSAEIHTSVADLLAYKPPQTGPEQPATPMVQQQQAPRLQRRMLLAHTANAAKAVRIASEIRNLFGNAALPWSSGVRKAFDTYLQSVME